MTILECKDRLFEYAKKSGFEDCEIYFSKTKDFEAKAFDQEIDNFTSSETIGLSFRGIYKGKMGYAYSEIMDDLTIKMLVEQALENAESIDSDDKEFFHDGKGNYKELNEYKGEFEKIDVEEKLQYALDIEKNLRAKEKVVQTNYCGYGDSTFEVSIFNTRGLEKKFKNDIAYLTGMAVVADKSNPKQPPKTGFSFKVAKTKKEIDIDYIVNEAHRRSISMLGAKSIKSGKYKIVLENMVVNDLMGTFSSIFSAEEVQKGRSLLRDRIGSKIANEKLTIIDDPHISGSITSASFDAEGIATFKKELINKGVLKTYLYNLKTAAKDGVKTTGNATKMSYKSPIMIAPSNLVIEKGNTSFDDLIKKCNKGLFITELAGLHSGANPISGDFSLMAAGFKVVDGKITYPVEQITISSNLFALFNNIEDIGNDVEQSHPRIVTYFSPSILISEMDIAGSEN